MCKSNFLDKAYVFLSQEIAAKRVEDEAAKAANSGLTELVPYSPAFRRMVTGELNELIESDDDYKIGRHPLQGDTLKTKEVFIVGGITIGTANNATEVDPETLSYVTPTALAFLHGEVVLSVADKVVFAMGIKDIVREQEKSETGIFDLRGVMKLINPKESIQITVRTPKTVALPADSNYIEVTLHGIKTQVK
ncbi:hypothetical protein V9L05_08660 [Bernardetia sp. Wsw4-3y2]|uniref:hypothetical protein n=1 Tax=Bernardetia sp. Wsw4-3y2 TaxID=3127471 RepID=UPI0030D23DED